MFDVIDYIKTQDGLRIRFGFSLSEIKPTPGSILFLNGRSEFLEKHKETTRELLDRGYDVFSFDWRGQGLSSRMLDNPLKGYVRDYSDYVRDMEQFVREIVLPRAVRPLTILSHSMGGHIAVRFLHDYQDIIDRAVLLSPMIDINPFPYTKWFARTLAKSVVRFGYGEQYALGCGDYRHTDEKSFKNNKLTSDFQRYTDERLEVEKNPNLALGGVTYQWLSATFDSTKLILQPGYAEKIRIPILTVSALHDRVVCVQSQQQFCLKLKNCKSVYLADSEHEILKENNIIRHKFWNFFDLFMENPDALGLTFGQEV